MKQVYIYDKFNRVWHWLQASLIIFLAITGFEVHGSYHFFGMENAAKWHEVSAVSLITLTAFAIFWHMTTGAWRQYIPTRENIMAQVNYYISGIFKNEPHPFKKTELSKLNPLQRIVYSGFKIALIPTMIITGIIYMYFKTADGDMINKLSWVNLEFIAVLHTFVAFNLVAFFIGHIYLTTTGHTITANIKAMITGYEDIEHSDELLETEKVNN